MTETTYHIIPLGDHAITIDFGNVIDELVNDKVIALWTNLRNEPIAGTVDLIPAYCSLTVVYDVLFIKQQRQAATSAFEWMKRQLSARLQLELGQINRNMRQMEIPVCYDVSLAPDLDFIASEHRLSIDEVIRIHTATIYRVFMIGFLPGFPYMATVDARIATPRKAHPRKSVPAGSVGIAGSQTGIYPLASPGGWQLIGQTPLQLFNTSNKNPALLQPGDQVQFFPVSLKEFKQSK